MLLVAGLQALVVAAVGFSLIRKPSAWRAWLLVVVTVGVGGLLVARTRVPLFGPGVAQDLRYLTDYAWLIPLAVAFAFHRGSVVQPRAPSAAGIRLRDLDPRAAAVVIPVFALYAVLCVSTATKLQHGWQGHDARTWVGNMQADLRRLELGARRPIVVDAPTPMFMIAAAFAPDNRLSKLLPLYAPHAHVTGIVNGPLFAARPDGHLAPARIGSRVPAQQRRAACVTAGAAAVPLQWTFPSGAEPGAAAVYLRVSYVAHNHVSLPIFVAVRNGGQPLPDGALDVDKGASTGLALLGAPSPRAVTVVVPAFQRLCVSHPELVTIHPA